MASPNLSDIATTTIQSRTRKLADNVTKNNALLRKLNTKGNMDPVYGGENILQELEYAENGTVKRYSGYETLNITPSSVFTSAQFNYAQYAAAVSISGLEMLQNDGDERQIDLLKARIKNAEKSLMNTVALDLYSDGTADGGRQIGGLQLLVSKTPTVGVVGGIDRATWAFWRNKSTISGTAADATNIQGRMNTMALSLVRGTDAPDIIVADSNYYSIYLSSLQAIQRITDEKEGGAGFNTLKYYGAGRSTDVVLDGGVGGGCPVNTMYFLNTDYIHFRPHAKRNFVPLEGERFATNQDAMVKLIGWAGNMTISNSALQGVLSQSV